MDIENSTGLPSGWRWEKLGNICQVMTGTTPPKSDMSNYGNKVPFFKPPHLWDQPIDSTEEKLSLKGATKARIAPPNSVLVTCIGNLGRTGITKLEAAFNQQLNAILENESISGKYIFYQAQSPSFRRQLEALATGTTVSIVNKKNFETIDIPVPPPVVQEMIVFKIDELFSELDKSIEELKTAQQQLKVYRQAVLKWAFEGKLTNDNVNGGKLPEGWRRVPLSEHIEQPKYGTSKKCDYDTPGIGVLRIPNIKNGAVDSSDLKYTQFDAEEIKSYALKEGDLLVIRSNGSVDIVGQCALIKKQDKSFLYAGYLIRLRPLQNKIVPRYLLHILSSSDLRNQIESKAKSTSGVNNINSEELKALEITVCSPEEQQQIVQEIESRLSVCDKIEETIIDSLKQAEALRQSILKQAFEGKLS